MQGDEGSGQRTTLSFQIEAMDAGRRVDDFLASRLGQLSRIGIARLVATGACRLNGSLAEAGRKVKSGDSLEFELTEPGPNAMTPEPLPIEAVFEDDDIIVVVKPAGMLVHPTLGVKSGTLANALVYHLNRNNESAGGGMVRPGLVHRLDRATSGLLAVAKTQRALSVLSRHFRKRLVEKRYLALVHGRMSGEGRIIAPIGRSSTESPHWRVDDQGKPAETRYQVVEEFSRAALLELEPVTGRTNQLRIHSAFIGHPIFGDDCYGRPASIEEEPGRLFLHAWRLAFNHPRTGERLVLTSPLPTELATFLDRYRITETSPFR